MGPRRLAREHALQVLYQVDLTRGDVEQAMRLFWSVEAAEDDTIAFAQRLIRGVIDAQERIDDLISGASTNWKVSRMSLVDRNVLRLGVFEFLEAPDVPPAVVINEGIELAKRFGTTESGAFVNGILDRVARDLGLSLKGRPE